MMTGKNRATLLCSSCLAILLSSPALAQQANGETSASAEAAEGSAPQEIIVTARKRAETLIEVPVVVTAVGAEELQNRAINNLDGVARIVPQLIIAPQGGSVQGGNISMRGIAGPDSNPFGD